MTEFPKFKTPRHRAFGVLSSWDLGFASDFGFRISDLLQPLLVGFMAALVPCGVAFGQQPIPAPVPEHYVACLPDDVATRGDWWPFYGTHVFILPGMRSPEQIRGGVGWPLLYKVYTSNSEDPARSWLSLRRVHDDRRVPHEPGTTKRTAGCWDDHGEEYPLLKGPDFYLDLEVPQGRFMLSLYFFEIDWIQYRAHTVTIFETAKGRDSPPLAAAKVDNYFNGKYKRFAISGPQNVTVKIARDASPNAVVSGVFFDYLFHPSLAPVEKLLASPPAAPPPTEKPNERLAKAAAEAKARHAKAVSPAATDAQIADYLAAEAHTFRTMRDAEEADPKFYYANAPKLVAETLARIAALQEARPTFKLAPKVLAIAYHGHRLMYDYAASDKLLGELSSALSLEARTGKDQVGALDALAGLATGCLTERGGQNIATAFNTLVTLFNQMLDAPNALDMTHQAALRALATNHPDLAVGALRQVRAKAGGKLPTKSRFLLGNALLVQGKFTEAAPELEATVDELPKGVKQTQGLLSLLSCYLGAKQDDKARAVYDRLAATNPGADVLAEARFRFAFAYLERGDKGNAEAEFKAILKQVPSGHIHEEAKNQLEALKAK